MQGGRMDVAGAGRKPGGLVAYEEVAGLFCL
jgi:hypothetical protein